MKPSCAMDRICKFISCNGETVTFSEKTEEARDQCTTYYEEVLVQVWQGQVMVAHLSENDGDLSGLKPENCEKVKVLFCTKNLNFSPIEGIHFFEWQGKTYEVYFVKKANVSGTPFLEVHGKKHEI